LQETTVPTLPTSQESLCEAPGVVLVSAGGEPSWGVLPLPPSGALQLGRGTVDGVTLEDSRMSRRHATIERSEGAWSIRDHDSTNGTFLEGTPVKGRVAASGGALVRLGNTLLLLVDDVRPFGTFPVRADDGVVIGPSLRAVHDRIAAIAKAGHALLIRGESGSGKELAARRFHEASRGQRAGPLVAINCATIPPGLAERLLFGARKGAYSGAETSTEGYFQAAHGGTLFLDEIAELALDVQAKLLRTLESGEVLSLGATRATQLDVKICCATHGDLRARVAAGSFRQDLFFRLARFEVELPPLRQRREEFPALIAALLGAASPGTPLRAEVGPRRAGRLPPLARQRPRAERRPPPRRPRRPRRQPLHRAPRGSPPPGGPPLPRRHSRRAAPSPLALRPPRRGPLRQGPPGRTRERVQGRLQARRLSQQAPSLDGKTRPHARRPQAVTPEAAGRGPEAAGPPGSRLPPPYSVQPTASVGKASTCRR
jgi:hypothetical protein